MRGGMERRMARGRTIRLKRPKRAPARRSWSQLPRKLMPGTIVVARRAIALARIESTRPMALLPVGLGGDHPIADGHLEEGAELGPHLDLCDAAHRLVDPVQYGDPRAGPQGETLHLEYLRQDPAHPLVRSRPPDA